MATQMIGETCTKEGIAPEPLALYADRGSAMRAKTVAQLLFELQAAKNHAPP